MECDVANESAVKSMYANAENKFGGVDVSVQCAGLSRAAPLLSGDANDWKIMQEVGRSYDTYSSDNNCSAVINLSQNILKFKDVYLATSKLHTVFVAQLDKYSGLPYLTPGIVCYLHSDY